MTEKKIWIELLRGVACLLVVLLHTSASYLYQLGIISQYSWVVGNLVDSFTRISVPLFFMISGFLFFGEKSPAPRHYLRLVLALLFYSIIALLYRAIIQGDSIIAGLLQIPFQPAFYHLWFFYSLFTVYVLAAFINARKIDFLHILMPLISVFILLNPSLSSVTTEFGLPINFGLQIPDTMYFFLFAVFGSVLGNSAVHRSSVNLFGLPALYFVASLAIATFTYYASMKAGEFVPVFYSYTGIFTVIGAFSVFAWFRVYSSNFKKIEKLLLIVSKNSLAIYGLHAFILDAINRGGYRSYGSPLIDILTTFIAVVLLSLIAAIGIAKVDYKRLVT